MRRETRPNTLSRVTNYWQGERWRQRPATRADDIDAFPATNIISSPRAHPSLDYLLGFLVRGGDAGAENGMRLPGPPGIEVKDEFHRGKVEGLRRNRNRRRAEA
jgi:hypothetical protein